MITNVPCATCAMPRTVSPQVRPTSVLMGNAPAGSTDWSNESLCPCACPCGLRHQRAALHPADGNEDEQEQPAGTGERQRDPGLNCDPFTLRLEPLTLETAPYIARSHDSSTAEDRRDRPSHVGHTSNAVSKLTSFPTLSPFLHHVFSLRCCGSPP